MSRALLRLETAGGAVIADEVAEARTILARARGLMLRRHLPPGHGLWIRPCNSIHMFFMRFPIDVAFLDRDGVVLHVLHGIRPWRMSRLVWRSASAVELPAGSLAQAGVERGAMLRLV